MAATERDIIETVTRNFKPLDPEIKSELNGMITPDTIFVLHVLFGPEVAEFVEDKQQQLQAKYGGGQGAAPTGPGMNAGAQPTPTPSAEPPRGM